MMRVRTLLSGSAIAVAAGVAAIAGYTVLQPARPVAAPAVQTATAEVTRGTLRDTKTVTGTLSYGELSSLRPALAGGSAMVTWIAPVGDTIERGKPLYRLDGQPTLLFYGGVPQHRTLRFDDDAASPIWVEREQAETAVQGATLALNLEEERLADAETRGADAAARLEDALAAVPASSEFVQLKGAVIAAEAKLARVRELAAAELTPAVEIAAAEAELAVAHANFDGVVRALRKELAGARLDAATARVAVANATVKLDDLRSTLDGLTVRVSDDADIRQIADNLAALGYEGGLSDQVRAWQRDAGLPVTAVVGPSNLVIAAGPVHIAAHSASVGETLAASSPDGGSIFDYSSVEKLVTVPLAVADQGLATVGRTVTVTLPSDAEVEGTISEVGSVVTNGTIEVTITIAGQTALAGLEVASVDVEFVSESRDNVLSVPVAALLARPEGGFALEAVRSGTSDLVGVQTGLFAAGRVEVSGDGIAAGMQVGVPR